MCAAGGANPAHQIEGLKRRPALVVGTPGRLAQLARDGSLSLATNRFVVLDEADQLLTPDFASEMRDIWQALDAQRPPPPKLFTQERIIGQGSAAAAAAEAAGAAALASSRWQTVMVSATLTHKFVQRSSEWCAHAVYISDAPAAAAVNADGSIGEAAVADAAVPGADAGPVSAASGAGASPAAPSNADAAGSAAGSALVGEQLQAQLQPQAQQQGPGPLRLPAQLRHVYIVSEPVHKLDTMRRFLHASKATHALAFMNATQRLKVCSCHVSTLPYVRQRLALPCKQGNAAQLSDCH